jgi:hypothetical protein
MHKDAATIHRAGRQTWNKRAERIHELIAIDIDADFEAAGLFTLLGLALSLLGLALSLTVLRAIPLTAQGLDLLTAGS